ncbi:type II secretion system protein [Ferrimonas sediminicola]|uniref:Type II secretion system protein n=1 Tax=Ferrimonas sediminicola TaxID=2569538 RepID=A0A4U1BIN9_9GAMM|nr:type II secretion system protein [Ferrimonas sediminicola]TKB51213.1 type II secretion system protein [Ferrimonas sediminicola]
MAGRQERGFTLIELVTTILLVTTLSVVALSRFLGADQFAVRATRDQLLAELSYLQQLSLARQNCSLNVASHGFWLDAGCGTPARLARQESCDSGDRVTNGVCLNDGVGLTFNGNRSFSITLDNRGRWPTCLAAGAPCRLTLTGSETLAVCIEPEGYIHGC